MAKTSPTEFVQQVRQEVARVTWPTRKETLVTTAMVFVMVFVAAHLLLRGRYGIVLWRAPVVRAWAVGVGA